MSQVFELDTVSLIASTVGTIIGYFVGRLVQKEAHRWEVFGRGC